MSTKDKTRVDFSDYEAYCESDFSPVEFANDLLLSTNSFDDTTLDIQTSLKRLQFDVEDIDKKIESEVANNYASLLTEFTHMKQFENNIKYIEPALNQLRSTYNRLDNEIIQPYNECMKLQIALKRIHQTNKLLRSCTFFIYLISKIEEIDKTENSLSQPPFKSLYQLSRLISQLKIHLNDSPHLKSLKVVRDYTQFQSIITSRCIDVSLDQFKKLNNSFDDKSLLNLIYTLMILTPEALYNQIQMLVTNKSRNAIQLLIKNINNIKTFIRLFADISSNGLLLSRIENILRKNKWIDSSNILDSRTIYDVVNEKLNFSPSVISTYWKDIAIGFEPKFKEIVLKGGPIVRNLRSINDDIKVNIRDSVLKSFADDIKRDDCVELTLMLNSVASLNKKKL